MVGAHALSTDDLWWRLAEPHAVRLLSAPRCIALDWKHLHTPRLHLPPLCVRMGATGERGPPATCALGLRACRSFPTSFCHPPPFPIPSLASASLTTLSLHPPSPPSLSPLPLHPPSAPSLSTLPLYPASPPYTSTLHHPTRAPPHASRQHMHFEPLPLNPSRSSPPLSTRPRQASTRSARGYTPRVIARRMTRL